MSISLTLLLPCRSRETPSIGLGVRTANANVIAGTEQSCLRAEHGTMMMKDDHFMGMIHGSIGEWVNEIQVKWNIIPFIYG